MKKIILVFTFIFIAFISTNVYADVISDINKQISDLSAEKKAAATKIAGLDNELSNHLYDIMMLEEKINRFAISLSDLQTKVDDVNAKLSEQEQALQNSAQLYNSAEEIYITRLKIIYENGIPSMLDVLLTSNSISDFFSKMNALSSILAYDKSLVSNMKNQKEYIDFIKSNIEIQKVQLETLKYDMEKSANALSDAKETKENKTKELQTSKQALKAKIDNLTKQQEEANKKLREELAKIANSTGSFNGKFAWPVPGYSYISAGYGKYDPWGSGASLNHWGIDIAGTGIKGKAIVAAEDGKVILVKDYGDRSYGKCVVIDHGKNLEDGQNYRTLYGHASEFKVVQGQQVTRGQTIALVGSTGNSTGPHLHFEVFKNGSNVNPIGYVK